MSFLYASTDIGRTGKAGNGVRVVDLPAQQYVSIGMTGMESTQAVKKALDKLKVWLKENRNYKADGEPRLLGYNSPMVPSNKRFWEVQIPVK